ncbi:MAG: hypothetical protein AAGC74_08240 [Verrucomicrobiota bacterium]
MDVELQKLEDELRRISPSPLSSEVVARMAEAMDRWEDDVPAEAKVVPFPTAKTERNSAGSWRPMWAAAAAVALMGALSGLIFPGGGDGIVSLNELGPVPVVRQASLVPVAAERNVNSIDAGVIRNRQGDPMQVIRIVREDQADFKTRSNIGIKVTRPQVDFYVVPVSY